MGSRHFWIDGPAFEAAALKAQIQYEKDVDEYVKKTQEKRYRVWIELDIPVDQDHAQELCDLANSMLRKLGINERGFFLDQRFHYAFGGVHDYESCPDRGKWLNLKYLGRDDK